MSNISGDGGSFHSGKNTGEDEGHHHHPLLHQSSAIGPEATPHRRPPRRRGASRHSRSECGGDCAVAANANGDEPVRVRDLPQGVPAGPEPAAAPARPQPAVEAAAAGERRRRGRGGAQEGVCVPGADVRAPRGVAGARGPDGDQEALLPEARREEVEVRQVQQEVRGAVGLEGPLQDLRHQGVQVRLWHRLLQERQLHHSQAFCDALGQESNKLNQPMMAHSNLQGPAHVLLSAGNAPVTTSVGLADFTDDAKDPQLKPFSDETALTSPRPLGMAGCMLSSFGPSSLHLKGTIGPLGLDGLGDANIGQGAAGSSGHMSATALLQKAAQMVVAAAVVAVVAVGVRMVDYLGVGPQRSPHEQHNPQQHVGLQGVIPHQRLQSLGPFQEMTHGLISLEKPIWDV
uniref:Uncharacterized protein n=1 Tax=Ananas comosus var. bracteatus TaxID=296719 RepID=A0A6V7PC77_ANACO|nr:unnamed protein product [Ananas comosus var. bracteatus]